MINSHTTFITLISCLSLLFLSVSVSARPAQVRLGRQQYEVSLDSHYSPPARCHGSCRKETETDTGTSTTTYTLTKTTTKTRSERMPTGNRTTTAIALPTTTARPIAETENETETSSTAMVTAPGEASSTTTTTTTTVTTTKSISTTTTTVVTLISVSITATISPQSPSLVSESPKCTQTLTFDTLPIPHTFFGPVPLLYGINFTNTDLFTPPIWSLPPLSPPNCIIRHSGHLPLHLRSADPADLFDLDSFAVHCGVLSAESCEVTLRGYDGGDRLVAVGRFEAPREGWGIVKARFEGLAWVDVETEAYLFLDNVVVARRRETCVPEF